MKTQRFINLEAQFTKAEAAFNANPNKQTATVLAKVRGEIASLREEDKYTSEYLQAQHLAFVNRITNLVVDSIIYK